MIFIKIFDTHCDTVYVMQRSGVEFDNPKTHIKKSDVNKYETFEQMFAIWSNPKRNDDENWQHYLLVKKYFDEKILPFKSDSFIPHLAVEGGALLGKDISKIDTLKEHGVRMMTLVWKDECHIGGAHNTNSGFTPFGKDVAKQLCTYGIIPDVSHASDKMTYETLEIAKQYGIPVCASHSNSRTVRNVTRNMTDDMFACIKKSGGLVGLNFCCDFLADIDVGPADITDILRHTEHFLALGGEKTLCLGCDLDGIKTLPLGIEGAGSFDRLYAEYKKIGYQDSLIEDIFYNNASAFFNQH